MCVCAATILTIHLHVPQNKVDFRVSSDFTGEWTSFSGEICTHNLLPESYPSSSGEFSGCKDKDSLTLTLTSPKYRTSGTCMGDCKDGPETVWFGRYITIPGMASLRLHRQYIWYTIFGTVWYCTVPHLHTQVGPMVLAWHWLLGLGGAREWYNMVCMVW